jgi:hypothetical protein
VKKERDRERKDFGIEAAAADIIGRSRASLGRTVEGKSGRGRSPFIG